MHVPTMGEMTSGCVTLKFLLTQHVSLDRFAEIETEFFSPTNHSPPMPFVSMPLR
jgi:hypothetical protein